MIRSLSYGTGSVRRMTPVAGLGQTAWTSASRGVSKGSIFFLHGTCDSGPGLKNWVGKILQRHFAFKDYRVIYPSSPIRPYHLLNDQDAAVWFNRLSPGPGMPEDQISIGQVAEQLKTMIQTEQETGKVILGGFSMGGSMALHLGYRFNPSVAGVFALSSFLPPDSPVFTELAQFAKENPQTPPEDGARISENGTLLEKKIQPSSGSRLPKLFMSLGSKDPLVRPVWTQNTFDKLRTYGIDGHLYTFPQQTHEILGPQLNILHNWIEETLSDSPKPEITETKPFHVNDEGTLPVPLRYWPNDNKRNR